MLRGLSLLLFLAAVALLSVVGEELRTGLKLLLCAGVRGADREPLLLAEDRDRVVGSCPPLRLFTSSGALHELFVAAPAVVLEACKGAFLPAGSQRSSLMGNISLEMLHHAAS